MMQLSFIVGMKLNSSTEDAWMVISITVDLVVINSSSPLILYALQDKPICPWVHSFINMNRIRSCLAALTEAC